MENPNHSTKEQLTSIVSLFKSGQSVKDISKIVGFAELTIQKWIKRFKDGGAKKVPEHEKRSGRPKMTTQRTLNLIWWQVETNPCISAGKIKGNNPQLLAHVSRRTVQRILHDRLHYRSRRKLCQTCQQVKNRIVFCWKYCDWDETKWRQVLWSDEAMFSVAENRGGDVYRRSDSDPLDPRYTRKTQKYPHSVIGVLLVIMVRKT